MEKRRLNRRDFLCLSATVAAGAVAAACAPATPQIVEKEVIREVPVEKPVVVEKEKPVIVEKEVVKEVPVEKIVKETVIVEKVVEKPPEKPVAPAGPAKVVIMHFLHEFTEDHVKLFEEENPAITLEVIQAEPTRFFAMYAAGSPPDLLRVQAPSVPQYLARKMLYDLTPFFEVSDVLKLDDLAPANDYYKGYSALEIGEGPIYGMCKDFSPDCTIFVYKPLFEDAGLEVPSDTKPLAYQDIVELSAKLTKFEGDRTISFGYAYEAGWVDRFMMNMLGELGQSVYSEDFSKLVLVDNEEAYAVAKYYYDLAAEKLAQSSINPSPAGWFGNDFTQGILAMAQYGFWYGAMAESDVTAGQVIMIPGPMWAGVRRDPTLTATGMIMAADTKVPEAAWEAFEYYNAGAPAIERAKSGWGVPALKSMWGMMPSGTEYEQQKLKALQAELALETSPLQFNPFLGETTVADSWSTQLDRALQGEITFDKMLANVESEVNAAIQEGIDRIL